ncbi:hypothetical protein SAY87_030689 [Trapa incisa]|uniref:Uncharacterized protein n=1 Tax=Trapa incisa TaxID=236973 RepID=A0AAN7KNM3_9MYRT|nr:hypothetical protein SAY87_030689 [Trapa incisa]
MEDTSNGKIEEALQKVEGAVKDDAETVIELVKGVAKDLVDGDSQPEKKEAGDQEESDSSSSSSSNSDGEKEDPREQTEDPVPAVAVEETAEEVSETVVDSTVTESEQSGGYNENIEVSEVKFQEEEVAIEASSEVASGVEVAEAVIEPPETTVVEAEVASDAPSSQVLPVEEETEGNLAPKGSDNSSAKPPENAPAVEQTPEEGTGNPPIIPVSPQVLHRTSWTSCCGLFEVLRRSDR